MLAIDTSSLLALVRYYLPFDKNGKLFELIQYKVESKELIVIDKVYDQCKYLAKGVVLEQLHYLKKHQYNTVDCLPNKTFFNQVDNNFINGTAKSRLKPEEFEAYKNIFLNDADAKLLLFCLSQQNLLTHPRIVTEETVGSNDNKPFKKIPALGKILNIEVLTLPDVLTEWGGIDLVFTN